MQRVSALVSTKWLADLLKASGHSENVRILDASWHLPTSGRNAKVEYQKQHIPGALFFDIDECADKKSTYGHMLPTPSEFQDYVSNLGINNHTHVVVYDNNERFGMFSAQRVWWSFRVFGHNAISILDGGLPKWLSENRPISNEHVQVPKEMFKANYCDSLVKSFQEIKSNITDKSFQLVDARAAGRFDGTSPEPRPNIEPGHIPESVNIPFMSVMDPSSKTVKTEAELRAMFEEAMVDLNKPLTASCGSGVSACCIALAAFLLGKEDVSIYDGSWTEWYQRSTPEQRIGCPRT